MKKNDETPSDIFEAESDETTNELPKNDPNNTTEENEEDVKDDPNNTTEENEEDVKDDPDNTAEETQNEKLDNGPAKSAAPPRRDEQDTSPALPKEPPVTGSPKWVTTFADLMSLLMCFFVMLLSMSNLDVEKFKALAEGMAKAMGAKPRVVAMDTLSEDQIETEARKARAERRARTRRDVKMLKNKLYKEIESSKLELEINDQMITLRILQGQSFAAGSADFRKSFLPVAAKLQSVLAEVKGFITVAGHTDNRPIKSKKFRSNWELSGSRAFSVINILLQSSKLPPERFVLIGHGDSRPITNNDTPENRARNRRVELVIDQRDVSLEAHDADLSKTKERFAPERERGDVEILLEKKGSGSSPPDNRRP